jgi:GNAT superfamily N-acetyltransferase
MSIVVVPLADPDQAFEINRAVNAHDLPDIPFAPRIDFLAMLHTPVPGYVTERHVALIDGDPAGVLQLEFPQLDNLDNADVSLRVRPECRRRGVGRALYAHALTRVREHGRKRIFGETVRRNPAGGAFATAVGAVPGLAETRSRLDLGTVDQGRLDDLRDASERHAADYRLVRWIGAVPDDLIDDLASLDGRLNLDAPMGDLEVEAEVVDAARIRAGEQMNRQRRRITINVGAVHVPTGRLAGWTQLAGALGITEQLWQQITIVDPDHRGHRLGLLIKIDNLAYAREHRPGLRVIDTFNASANEPMLAINRTLGFEPVDAWTQWQQRVA